MRNKKKRSSSGHEPCDTERPMSWEGELSDSEMVIDTSVNMREFFFIRIAVAVPRFGRKKD